MRKQICDLYIVPVGKREMGIALYPCLRQMHKSGIAAVPVYRSASGLIHQIHREAAAQKDILKAVTAIRGRFPGAGGLTGAMQKNKRGFISPGRYLIKD